MTFRPMFGGVFQSEHLLLVHLSLLYGADFRNSGQTSRCRAAEAFRARWHTTRGLTIVSM